MASDFLKRRIRERDEQRGQQTEQQTEQTAGSTFLQQRIQQRDQQRAESGYRAPTGTHKTMLGMTAEEYKTKVDEARAAWQNTSATTQDGGANKLEAAARKNYNSMLKQYKALLAREEEKQQAQAAQQEYDELRTLDLDEYRARLEEAKSAAQTEKTKQARDQLEGAKGLRTYSGQAQTDYAEMERKYNLARQIQYDERGEEALGKLSDEQAAAVETLAKAKSQGRKTDITGAGAGDDERRSAERVLTAAGYSAEEIDNLTDWRSRQINAQKYDAAVEKREKLATSSPAGAALATALSVPETLMSGIGLIDVAIQNNENKGTDRPADYKRTAMRPYAKATAARGAVSQQLEENTNAEIFGQNIASGLYNIGTSILDSTAVAGLAALGVPPMAATSLLGGSAATSAMADAHERGVSDEQAALTGLAAGVAESLFEEVSLEKLLTLKPAVGTIGQRVRTTLKNVGLQAATEGSEEFFTTLANTMTDRLINGGLSEMQQSIRDYMEQGMSEEQARRQAYLDLAGQLTLDFTGGAVAGGLMAGGQTALQTGRRNAAIAREYGDIAPGAAQDRLNADESDRLAKDVQSRAESNRRVGGGAIAELVSRNVQTENAQTQSAIAEAAAQRLTQLGEPENVQQVAEAAAQLTADTSMTQRQRREAQQILQNSRYGERVLGELTEGMQLGSEDITAQTAQQEETAAPDAERVRQAVADTQRSRGAENLTESRGGEERTQSGRRFSSEWAANLPDVLTEEAYVRRLQETRVNPQATDKRTVTGTAYNKESGKLDVIVKGTDGKTETIPAEQAATTGRQERLMDLAATVGEAGPQMYAAILDTQDVEKYARQWRNAYTYGEANVPRGYAMQSQAVDYLTAEQRDIAYEAGKAAYAQKLAKARTEREGTGTDTPGKKKGTVKLTGAIIGGTRYDGVSKTAMTERQKANVRVLEKLAEATGVDIVLYQSRVNERGEYEGQNGAYKDGTLYLDINAGRNSAGDLSEVAIVRTAAHELTHFIQDLNPAAYAEYRDYVVGLLTEKEGMDFDALVEHKQTLQPELSYSEAVDEVVADGSEMLLRDTTAVQRLAEENRGLFRKIQAWLRRWAENIHKAFEGISAEHAEARALEEHLETMQKLWDEALIGASRNLRRGAETASETQMQIRQLDGETTVVLDTQNDTRAYKAAEAYLKTLVNAKRPFSTILTDALPVYIGKDLPKEYRGSEYTHGMNRALREVKMQAATNLDEMLLLAENGEWRENVKDKHRTDAKNGWYRYETQFAVPVLDAKKAVDHYTVYGGTLLIRNDADGKSYLYDLIDVEKKKVISSPSFSAQAHSDVFEPKPSQAQYTREKAGSQGKSSGGEKFSMRDPVEQTRDLVAVHNMTEKNLRDALRLGGLPMPSIAVVKAAQGHSMYGPISIVFGRDSIDPQTDSRNKIYGGDAYTPTAPAVEYPVDYDRMRTVEKRLTGLSGKIAGGVFRNDSALQRAGIGEESSMSASELADKLSKDDSIRAAYLADQGKTLEPVMQAKEFNRYGNDALAKLVEKIGVQELASIEASMEAGDYQPVREIEDTVRQIIRDSYAEKHSALLDRKPELKEKRLNRFMENNVTLFTVEDFVRDAWEYYQDQGATTSEVDRWATSDRLHEAASTEDVKAWLLPQLEGVLGEPGIYNGSERFDKSGGRRSFSQLHWEYTLENIVLAMTETQAERGGQTFGVSAKAMQAVSTEDFRSIDEVKAASGRLGEVDTKQYEDAVQAVEKRIEQVTQAIMRENKPHSDSQFDEMQIIGDVLMQAAQGKRTETAIRRVFSKEGYSISESTATGIREMFRSAAELPTGYFEAKPQRAVGFEEAKAIIVPDNLSAALKRALTQSGATVREYKAGDETSRLAALNADDSVKFSVRDYGLTEEEEHAIVSYKSGDSYTLNGKLSTGGELTSQQRRLRDHLDAALEKLPVYRGTVYRHYDFDAFGGFDAMADFLSQFSKGNPKRMDAYLSASTVPNENRTGGEYTVDMVIRSETGRSLNGFGLNTENEVLLPRETKLVVDSMELVSPHKIRMTAREVVNNENGATAEAERTGMRNVREGAQGRNDLRPVSGQNSEEVLGQGRRNPGRDGDARLSGLREGTRPGSLDESGVEGNRGEDSEGRVKLQPRERSVSDRQILANALERVAQNERERSILADYREKAAKMAFYERELAKREQKIADHRSGQTPLEPDALKRAEKSAEQYTRLISQQDERLLRLEKLKPLRDVVTRERDYIAERLRGAEEEKSRYTAEFERQLSEERRRGEERLNQYRAKREEREEILVERRQIERTAKRLTTYLEENTDKKHIPEALKKPIGELLQSLDFSSKTRLSGGAATKADLAYIRSMQQIETVLASQERWEESGEGGDLITGTLDLPKGFSEALKEQIERVQTIMETHQPGERAVMRMNLADLRKLRTMLSTLSSAVTKMNELFANGRFRHVDQAAQDTIFTLREKGQHQSLLPKVESFVRWDNTLPWYAFQRLGEGGQSIFAELQDGWDKLAFNTQKILKFRKELIDDKTARKWDTEVHEVELTDQDDNTVKAKLTTAQLMSLYCLSRRKQALGHLLGGGIRPADIELTANIKDKVLKKTEKQDTHYHLTDERLGQLLGLLTDEQREIAQKMQKYMTEQGATWGNEITMARWGYRAFTEENYFPLTTDREDRPARADDAAEGSLYRLQNISATKPLTQNANNAVMLYSIFDVYADHMADMAKYNAMVLPILDAQKWYNYREGHKNEAGQVSTWTVQRTLTQVYGRDANRYVIQFLKDLNGVKESGARGEGIAKKMISNYKRAAVAANLRVALLQPTAYVRAAAVLDGKYLTRAFGEKTSTKAATAEMLEHSGIGLWKSMGMFDTDVGRSIRDQIKGRGSAVESLVDKTMVLAEKGDSITWARLWRACKLEVQDKQHLQGEALLDATAKRFREVIYRTQVIDSTMTRSHMMRSGSTFAAIFTSFMSEPTVSYNLIMTASEKILEDAKKVGMKTAVKRNWKTAGRAWQAYILSAVASAMVEALADAWRDSGDDKDTEKLLNAFKDNLGSDLNPLNKLPGLRDVFSIFEGYDTNRTDMAAVSNLNKAIAIWKETIQLANGTIDEATDTTYHGNMTIYGKVYKTAQALSQLSGLPVSATMREAQALWNNTVGRWAPGLKQKTYDNEKQRLIQNAGTAMWNDDKDTWQDAYAALEQYMLSDGKSKREAESAVYSEMRKAVKDSYLAGELTETEARQKLVNFLGSDAEKAAQQVTSWKNGSEFAKEVGFEYGEMRSAYETGRIQKSEAVRLRQKYGGETQEEAESKVRYWDFCIEYPQYDDISEARANKYYDYCQKAGVGVAAYYKAAQYTAAIESEKDEDGETISGSVKRQYVEYIQSLGLSAAQQKALWQALKNATWSDKDTPWE